MVPKQKVALALTAAGILTATTSAAVKAHMTARSRRQPKRKYSPLRQVVTSAYYRVADPVENWMHDSVSPMLQAAVAFVAIDAAESSANQSHHSDYGSSHHFSGVSSYSGGGDYSGGSSSSSDSGGGSFGD